MDEDRRATVTRPRGNRRAVLATLAGLALAAPLFLGLDALWSRWDAPPALKFPAVALLFLAGTAGAVALYFLRLLPLIHRLTGRRGGG